MHVCMYVYMYVCMYVCIYVCMRVCLDMCVHLRQYSKPWLSSWTAFMLLVLYKCLVAFICVWSVEALDILRLITRGSSVTFALDKPPAREIIPEDIVLPLTIENLATLKNCTYSKTPYYIYIYLFIYLFTYLFVCLFIYLFVTVFIAISSFLTVVQTLCSHMSVRICNDWSFHSEKIVGDCVTTFLKVCHPLHEIKYTK